VQRFTTAKGDILTGSFVEWPRTPRPARSSRVAVRGHIVHLDTDRRHRPTLGLPAFKYIPKFGKGRRSL